jgi:hypothetical protein
MYAICRHTGRVSDEAFRVIRPVKMKWAFCDAFHVDQLAARVVGAGCKMVLVENMHMTKSVLF